MKSPSPGTRAIIILRYVFVANFDLNLSNCYTLILMLRGRANRLASARSAKQHANRVRSRRRTQKAKLLDDSESDPLLDTKKMTGELPPFNDLGHFVVDIVRETVYTYGGYRPAGETPTADFFMCDMGTLKWKNLTVSNTAILSRHSYTPGPKTI